MRRIPGLCALASTGFLATTVSAAPGDLLVSEPMNGTVLEFSAGGDLAAAPRFATGLMLPTGLCVGPGGDIYVGEIDSAGNTSEITIITAGGSFSATPPFAFGFRGVIELVCDDNNVFAADQNAVYEASAGGDFSMAMPFAFGMEVPIGLAIDGQGTLWTSTLTGGLTFDITGGGDFSMAMPHSFGRASTILEVFDGMLLGNDFASAGVFDLTAGGDVSMAIPFATLPSDVAGLLDAGPGTLYAATSTEIYEVSAGGDFSMATPFATGLMVGMEPIAPMLRHVCSDDADCDDADVCNGTESCANNECFAGTDPLECDDMDVCTADSCDPAMGCVGDPILGCCEADADCETGEVCDVPNNMCVPDMMGTTGGETGGMTSGPGTTTGGDGSTGDDGGTAGADDDGDDGCSCRADAGLGDRALWALGVLPWIRRRRGAPSKR